MAAIVAGVALVVLITLTAAPFRGETLIVTWQWLPSIGLDVAFRFDGLGMLFAYLADLFVTPILIRRLKVR